MPIILPGLWQKPSGQWKSDGKLRRTAKRTRVSLAFRAGCDFDALALCAGQKDHP